MTVEALTASMSSAEFGDWQEYAALEPFGPLREDRRAGIIVATLANVNRDPKRRAEAWEPEDFFPELAQPRPPVDIKAKVRAVFASFPRRK